MEKESEGYANIEREGHKALPDTSSEGVANNFREKHKKNLEYFVI
jgi:hypothetical protein